MTEPTAEERIEAIQDILDKKYAKFVNMVSDEIYLNLTAIEAELTRLRQIEIDKDIVIREMAEELHGSNLCSRNGDYVIIYHNNSVNDIITYFENEVDKCE